MQVPLVRSPFFYFGCFSFLLIFTQVFGSVGGASQCEEQQQQEEHNHETHFSSKIAYSQNYNDCLDISQNECTSYNHSCPDVNRSTISVSNFEFNTKNGTMTTGFSQKLSQKLLELSEGADIGVAQELPQEEYEENEVKRILEEARDYLEHSVRGKEGMNVDMCRNQHTKCSIWAMLGECEANPRYMKEKCAPVCKSCEYLTVEGRCPIDPNALNAWVPGDLNKMFQRLTSEPYLSQYSVEILSSPDTTDGPWVITMENVVSEIEAEHLIELGGNEGYERSGNVGPLKPDGTIEVLFDDDRTSTNAWCQRECYRNATALKVVERLSDLTQIEEKNSEYLQLLRYEVSQHYGSHHDYIDHHIHRQQGVRMLTVYLYLNDVPAGGGTNFDKLNLTVLPKRGRALLWPSVFDNKPNEIDERTSHQALPVEEGVKYGANAWFHMRDYKTPFHRKCS